MSKLYFLSPNAGYVYEVDDAVNDINASNFYSKEIPDTDTAYIAWAVNKTILQAETTELLGSDYGLWEGLYSPWRILPQETASEKIERILDLPLAGIQNVLGSNPVVLTSTGGISTSVMLDEVEYVCSASLTLSTGNWLVFCHTSLDVTVSSGVATDMVYLISGKVKVNGVSESCVSVFKGVTTSAGTVCSTGTTIHKIINANNTAITCIQAQNQIIPDHAIVNESKCSLFAFKISN